MQSSLSNEAEFYYYGLPSRPRLVGRSSTHEWVAPCGPGVFPRHKQLQPVGMHPINDIWEGDLSYKVVERLNSKQLSWTSIDVVRIGFVDESFSPVILWIGVEPDTLSYKQGMAVAHSCHEILVKSGITNVDVEMRESCVILLAGPKLLAPTFYPEATAEVRNPLTTTLGLPIACQKTPYKEGTGGIFLAEGGNSRRIFLLTTRHVVLEIYGKDNKTFFHKPSTSSMQSQDIMLLGDRAFQKFLDSIESEIDGKKINIDYLKRVIRWMIDHDEACNKERKYCEEKSYELAAKQKSLSTLESFKILKDSDWNRPEMRILGNVVYSPPYAYGSGKDKYTQDFALIEIDQSKINSTNFMGNVIDLGNKIPLVEFVEKMYPNIPNADLFESWYPLDGLLRVKDIIPESEIRGLTSFNENENCLMVIKHGNTSGLTIGRACGLRSIVHNYMERGIIEKHITEGSIVEEGIVEEGIAEEGIAEEGIAEKGIAEGIAEEGIAEEEGIMEEGIAEASMEWAILQYDKKSGPFSEVGDSGSSVVDGRGRLGGIITSGAGSAHGIDVTYASSINSLMADIKGKFPEAHLNPQINKD